MSFAVDIVNLADFTAGVERFAADVLAATRTAVAETVDEAAAHGRAVGAFQDRTGALRRSIVGRVVRRDQQGTSGVVEATAPHAVFVEDDTRPHEIRPRNARMLRWEQGGEVRFARVVQHPGTRGKPFMGPAAIKAEAALYAKMHERTAAAVARASR
jgi:hypothetical protein